MPKKEANNKDRNSERLVKTKQSKILKKVSKKVAGINKAGKTKNEAALPAHHFKKIKVKRGISGLGLFAQEPIKKGEMIVEYIGNILTAEEAEKRVTSQYLFEINKHKTIDGTPRWNTARYCNHSCDPNAESDVKKGRVLVLAVKNIKEGEEITYDYGEEFVLEHIAPHGCRCSAKKHLYGMKGPSEKVEGGR
jgi:SET domain-containing protein